MAEENNNNVDDLDEKDELNGNDEGQNKDENNDENGNQDSGETGNNDSGKERTFTQEEVNRMMAKEKRQGKSSVYKELGIDPNDKKSLAMIKALVNSQKDDDENDQNSTSELDEANHRAMVAEAKAEAMMIGILPKYVEDVVSLALPKVTEEKDLKSVMKELKAKYPIWVKPDDSDPNNKGKTGTGSSLGNSGSKGGDDKPKGIGARLAASRKASKPKQSYWGNKR